MTMKRSDKAEATGMLKKILAGHQEQAQSPKLRAQMVSDHGAPTYTAGAWVSHRMGRGQAGQPVEAIRAAKATTKIQAGRTTTRH
jgi:hypothetical protein